MIALYFKSSPETYAQIQPAIDDAFRADWIETVKCEHILPIEPPIQLDNFCYLSIPNWMIEVVGAETFINWPGVTQITQEEYLLATQSSELL